jgi:hypothetical protein
MARARHRRQRAAVGHFRTQHCQGGRIDDGDDRRRERSPRGHRRPVVRRDGCAAWWDGPKVRSPNTIVAWSFSSMSIVKSRADGVLNARLSRNVQR